MSFQEVFVEDKYIKLPTPFKRDLEWITEFKLLNNILDEDEDENEYKDDTGAYLMIRNIGYLFDSMGDFSCNKDKNFFVLWGLKESVIKKRIEVINKCLDVYDIFFPFTMRKPILSKTDLENVYKLMDRLFYDTCYPIMDENGVDLNMELGSPGWLDLKKVLLRFFSKIKINRKFNKFEEEVEGTGHVRPLYRKDGTSLKGTGTFLIGLSKDEDEEENCELEEIKVDKTEGIKIKKI